MAGKDSNYPPLHPFCRTAAVTNFTKSEYDGYRPVRNPVIDKAIKIPVDSIYRNWEFILVKKHGTTSVSTMCTQVKTIVLIRISMRKCHNLLILKTYQASIDFKK